MTTTIQAVRRRGALGVFAATLATVLLATGTPRIAAGHEGGDGTFHLPESPQNLRVTGIAGTTHNAVVVSWDAGHSHPKTPFALYGFTVHVTPSPVGATPHPALPPECLPEGGDGWLPVRPVRRIHRPPPLGNFILAGGATSYTAIVAGLRLETAHSVSVTALYGRACTAATTGRLPFSEPRFPTP